MAVIYIYGGGQFFSPPPAFILNIGPSEVQYGTLDHYLEFLEDFPIYVVCPVLCRRQCVVKGSMRPPNAGKPTQTMEHVPPDIIKLDDTLPNILLNISCKLLISLNKTYVIQSSFYCYCTIILFISSMFSMT